MLVAVQSPDGTKRIECEPTEKTSLFLIKIQRAFNLDSVFSFEIYRNKNRKGQVIYHERKTLSSYNIKHGDTIYLVYKNSKIESATNVIASTSNSTPDSHRNFVHTVGNNSSFVEDPVDTFLFKQDGYIHRNRDEKLCQHGAHGKCVHCIPVEPYNEEYLREQNIKHMSFHSYLRKLTGGADKGKFAALENISCKIKPGCKEHSPWPQGICTKCQPNAITLNRQPYRHVDNIVFENAFIVERFLNYWRCTGHQRIGLLYGRYEPHKDVPLGIKAVVAAIYEPSQDGSEDFLRLLPDDKSELVDQIACSLGLVKVGWIFTDLVAEDLQKGTVKHLRNISSHFLSAQECIMAGYFQDQHPNPCRLSPDGYFGSKFVTVCVTGDADNHVHMEGYQVSNQCMALVRDKCLVPSIDAPELGYVKESTNEQYIPDVFYKEKDTYGNEVTKLARPLPIEYLLIDVPVSTPVEPQFTFYADVSVEPFPVENRMLERMQDFRTLASYLRQFKPDQFLEAISDFHLLVYIATMDMLPLKDALDPLLKAVKMKNKVLAENWAKNDHWATVEHLLDAEGTSRSESPTTGQATIKNKPTALWTCQHCTFLNQPEVNTCEICGLPQSH